MSIIKKVKENRAVSLADVAIGLIVLMIFTGIFTTWIYQIYKHNYLTKQDALVTNYMVKIAEEIDLLPYEEIDEDLSETINQECDIPDEYEVSFTIVDYKLNEETQDIIKYVTINIKYEVLGEELIYSIKKLKIKEI